MKILVTVASGFVGSRACSHLEAAGHDVIRLSHSNHSGFRNEYLLGIAEREAFAQINDIDGIDAVVHCAGVAHRFGRTSKEEFWRVNVEAPATLLSLRCGMGSPVHTSQFRPCLRNTDVEPSGDGESKARSRRRLRIQ